MTSWKSEEQFIEDRCLLSEFYYSHKKEPENKFVFKCKKPEEKTIQSLYFDSDSEEEIPDYDTDSRNNLQVLNDIRTQIKNAVGHRYSNEVIESYYNVERNARKLENKIPSTNSNTVTSSTVNYSAINNDIPNKETTPTKSPTTANTENKTKTVGNGRRRKGREQNLSKSGNSSTSSSSSTPKKYYANNGSGDARFNKSPKRFEFRNGTNYTSSKNDHSKYFHQPVGQSIDLNSTKDFPRLS